uniref:Laminin, beta 2-like n=1 Tax=Sparus aurata TaxID=8175 RepID=A0A671XM86_SPAAU
MWNGALARVNGPMSCAHLGLILSDIFLPGTQLQDLQDLQDQCPTGSCNPQLGDLMVGRAAQLSASSTCGLGGPQNYCIIGYLEEEQKCFTCDSRLPYNRYSNPNSHHIENVITTFDPERKMKWWQSENGVHHVSIRLDLEAVFQFSHLVLTFKSFRPAAMLVERSKDFGQSWKVFRFFAEDCSLNFPSVSNQPANSIDDVICDSRYSGSQPSTDGEVVLKALDPIFEIENPYAPNIQDLITLTNIRINFTRLFTLGDTLLGRRRRNAQDKYYYALYNMVVRGSCFCNGHASQCTPVDRRRGDVFTQTGMVHGRCVCWHNTAGENCERCQDFHHDSPWRPGGENTVDICRSCNCHGHSVSCHFDAARFEATGGVSGGVCDDCRHDRTGPQCERCRPFLYQDPQRAVEDPHACIPCDCDPAGSQGGGLCDALSGRCVCKENVDGQRCDRCKQGFFNLRQDNPAGCQACRCHGLGSVGSCDQVTGSCECNLLATGPLCDRCLTRPRVAEVLTSCLLRCSPEDGQCHCLPNMVGRRCSDPAPGHFLPPLDYFLYEAELASPLHGGIVPRQKTADQPVTWTGLGLVRVLEGVGLRFTVDNLPSSMDYQLVIRYEPEVRKTVNFCSQSDLDAFRSFRCIGLAAELNPQESLPDVCEGLVKSMSARIHNGAAPCRCNVAGSLGPFCSELGGLCECKPNVIGRCCDTCAPLTFGFGPAGCKPCECDPSGSVSELCDQIRGQCACRSDVTGRRCDRCQMGFWSFPFCRACECNGLSEECDEETGECLNCREHATGPNCDRCMDGYYGDPVSRQPCQPCLCPDVQNSGRFFATSCQHNPQSLSMACNCREGHTGLRCDRCSPGFYGNLALPGASCEECPCNNNIELGDRNACDGLTGECLRCLHNTFGPRCQDCKPGYYGNALDQDCKECSCDRRGTEVTQCPLGSPCFCDSRTGQCPCRTGVEGVLCDECEDGYWNLGGVSGCQPCSCDPVNSFSNICNKVTGQCPCRSEFGGRQCDECGENHFGNPDLQCISCDCNMEGTERPSCDPETGECICRIGVTGIFCDECAPGYDSTFPACRQCHPCTALWTEDVTDVQRAALMMRTFIPHHSDNLWPGNSRRRQGMLEMHSKLDSLSNLTGLSLPKVEKVERLCAMIGSVWWSDAGLCCGLMQVCGAAGLEDCSGCAGALCVLDLGKRRCGGPDCDGAVPVSQKASEMADRANEQLITLPSRLQESNNKAGSRNTSTDIILQYLRHYISVPALTDEMVPPEDIEKMARTVLDIQLPRSPDQIRSMINDINNLLSNASNSQDNLSNLEEHAKTGQDLLQKAQELKSVSENMTEHSPSVTLPDDLFSVLFQIKDKMDDIETKLMDRRAEALKDEIDALKKKTEQNRQMARDAGETADAVLNNTTDTQTVRLLTHTHTHRLLTHTHTHTDYRHTHRLLTHTHTHTHTHRLLTHTHTQTTDTHTHTDYRHTHRLLLVFTITVFSLTVSNRIWTM